ncbi:ANTAR domain-containing protein [Sanguibacter suaedae]|uniref:ANTAR domain-containing protein n=1 Tax=Sanguibacter suaedae TaxID=2795737 RepID=A0A934I8I2_9MICO|nr:ANTAR domain-containing protein [Sanguibacter suaedae]MBI9116176.1 ANTAR domain-containing protein [Sanguibacter suaedae]
MTDKADVLARLAHVVARSQAEEPLVARLCRASVDVLGGDGAMITLSSTGANVIPVCATDPTGARLEDLQEVLGEGPGALSLSSGRIVVSRVDSDDRWPMLAGAVLDALGRVVVHAIPMRPGTTTLGVLSLYTQGDEHGGSSATHEDMQFLADAVGAALLQDGDVAAQVGRSAWVDRARVHQATGMVVAQLGTGPQDALALLRAHAYASSVSLDDIAAAVLDRSLNFTDSTNQDWSEDR